MKTYKIEKSASHTQANSKKRIEFVCIAFKEKDQSLKDFHIFFTAIQIFYLLW